MYDDIPDGFSLLTGTRLGLTPEEEGRIQAEAFLRALDEKQTSPAFNRALGKLEAEREIELKRREEFARKAEEESRERVMRGFHEKPKTPSMPTEDDINRIEKLQDESLQLQKDVKALRDKKQQNLQDRSPEKFVPLPSSDTDISQLGRRIGNSVIAAVSDTPPVASASGYSDIPDGFSVVSRQPSWREDIMSELDRNPATRRLTMQMLETEGGGVATLEALANRTAMIRQKVPDWTIGDELTSGFYGPINKGRAQRISLSPQSIERHQQDIDEVRAGSNVIQGRTDQGWAGDPNSTGPGRVRVPGNSDIYNYWTGKRHGVDFSHEDSARFADEVIKGGPKFADTGSDWAKRAVIEERNAPYNDIPQGFSVQSQGPTYSDVPEGSAITFAPSDGQQYDTKLSPDKQPRERLSSAISEVEKQGYKAPHFIGSPDEPEGDRAPTMDMENLVSALKKQEADTEDETSKAKIAKERAYWENEIATKGMSAKQWKDQTGEDDPQYKREVGAIESGYRGAKSSALGLSQTIAKHGIAPFVHGVRQAIEAVEPDSKLSKFIQNADDSFWKRFVSDVEKQRDDLAFDPNTEERTLAGYKGKAAEFAGEASEAIGGIVPDIGATVITGGATTAPRGLLAGLGHSAGNFTLPAAKSGMDAARREEKSGGSVADQAKAFVRGMLQTQFMAAVPMNVESQLSTIPLRASSRMAQAAPLAAAQNEGLRNIENAASIAIGRPEDYQKFDPERAAIGAAPAILLGGALGRNARPIKPDYHGPGSLAEPKKMAPWLREEMDRQGLDPNRPFNDIDITNPSVIEAIKNDPTLSEVEKQNILKTGSPLGIVANPKAAKGAAMLGKALQGGKKPSGRPSILPVYRGDVFRLYEGTADVLEKSGFTELGAKLRDYVDNRRKHSGHLDNQFRTWSKGMSSSQIKAAEGEFSKYWEAADRGDMAEASQAYGSASPKGKEAIDTWKKVSGDAAHMASKAGFYIFDGKQWKPFRARENFFPRRIKPEWRNVLRNPEKHPEQYEALKREAIAKGMVKNGAEFDKRVDSALESSGPNKIATVERSRKVELPSQVYDYGFETARNYIAAFSDAIAKTEAFGQAKGKNLAPAFKKAQELARDDYSKNYINKVEKAINPAIDPDAWVAQLARGVSTVSFLGNIRSSMRNLTSGALFNLQHHGIRAGTRSILEAGRASKEIDNAYEKGILHSDLANMMTNDVTTAGQAVNKLTNKVLTWQGYKAVEEWTRALALVGARGKLRSAIREAQENPTSKATINNSAYFKRLGIDPVALLDEAGEGPLTDRFLRSSVAEIQGGYGIDQTPLLLQSEAGKTLFHLQKWGTQALRHFDRNVVNPALQTIKLGRKESVNIRDKDGNIIETRVPGSLRPLARYIFLASAFGLVQKEAEEWIFGIPDKEASFAEIMMRMNKDTADAFGMLAHKLYSASLSVGALGTLGGFAKTLEVAGFENALTPPPLQILSNAKNFITKWMDQGQITGNNVRDVLSNQISGVRTTGQILARTNVFGKDFPYLEMIRKKQELTWLRSVERRMEDDIGYERKPFGGDIRANPMTPFYADIEEKLLIGDASGARKAIRDHFKGMSEEKVKLGMEGLKKSVLGNRPIRVGGSSGEARRENVLQWTKKNLPKVDQIRIKKIDDTYRNTAIRVELMNPKPVSFEQMQEDMRNLKLRNELLSGE